MIVVLRWIRPGLYGGGAASPAFAPPAADHASADPFPAKAQELPILNLLLIYEV